MSRPRFSIVIPTCRRPELLGSAIRSALRQTVDDLEVVVSSCGADDETIAVVAGFDDPRLRLTRTTPRPMHRSWRFALAQTRGAVVAFLCDDDALHPRALERVARVLDDTDAEVVAWRSCTHYGSDWFDDADRGTLHFGPPVSDRVFEIDGARLVAMAFELRVTFTDLAPKLLNGAVTRPLLDRLVAAGEEPFEPSCPDYSAMVTLAASARRMVLLDTPLLVTGATRRSIGASALRHAAAATQYLDALRRDEPDLVLPPGVGPRVTWLAQTYLQCVAAGGALRDHAVDPVHLYGLAQIELRRSREDGYDVTTQQADLDATLAGPMRRHADAIRVFAADDRGIESEAFLTTTIAERVSGRGAFDVPADTDDFAEAILDEVALALDAWLDGNAVPLGPWWDELASRGEDRRIVLYGLGRNGRALLRTRSARPHALFAFDDHADGKAAACVAVPAATDLDPARDLVVLTFDAPDHVRRRLRRRGFAEGKTLIGLRRRPRVATMSPA